MMKHRATALTILMILLLFLLPLRAGAESGAAASASGEENTAEETHAFPENGIPVLTLTIDPEEYQKVVSSYRHEYRAENGSIRLDVPDGWTSEYGEADGETLGRELPLAYIRGRGNSTWLEDKKPYRFRLAESADIFGMGANEHWVLLANAKDDSLLRNRIAACVGDALGLAFTPKFVPVDLVVNGEYQGSYLLGEQVRIGENRIEIDKIKKSQTGLPEISGGYLLAMSPSEKDTDAGKFTLKSGMSFLVEEPELDEYGEPQQAALEAQKDYIVKYMQSVEDAVFGEDFRNAEGAAVSELMDLESAAKYWWVQCFAYNDDGFDSTSTYLYKERDGKLFWGPLWDFDRSFWINGGANFLNNAKMPWLDHLRANDPEYQQILRAAWEELQDILEEVIREGGVLDRYREEIRLSWEQDHELWRGAPRDDGELDRTVESIRGNIRERREAIGAVIDTGLARVFAEVTFADGEQVLARKTVYAGESLSAGDFPEAEEKEGFAFLGWTDGNGQEFGRDSRVFSDMTVLAAYREKETAPETKPAPQEADGTDSAGWIIAAGAVSVLIAGAAASVLRGRRKMDKS